MAYKEVSRVEITEIIWRWQSGASVRGLARVSGVFCNTIKRYILVAQNCGLSSKGPPPTESRIITLVQLNVAGHRTAAVPAETILDDTTGVGQCMWRWVDQWWWLFTVVVVFVKAMIVFISERFRIGEKGIAVIKLQPI